MSQPSLTGTARAGDAVNVVGLRLKSYTLSEVTTIAAYSLQKAERESPRD